MESLVSSQMEYEMVLIVLVLTYWQEVRHSWSALLMKRPDVPVAMAQVLSQSL